MRIRTFVPWALACALPLAACSGQDKLNDNNNSVVGAFAAQDAQAYQLAEQMALQALYMESSNYLAGVDTIETSKVKIDELNMAHTRVQQFEAGIPVFDGEAIVHLDTAGNVSTFTDGFIRNITADFTKNIKDTEALETAIAAVGGIDTITNKPEAELFVLRHEDQDYLTFKVAIEQLDPDQDLAMPVLFIDARTGEEITRYDNLQSARNRRIHDGNETSSLPGTLTISEGQGEIGDIQENQLYRFSGHVYDYFQEKFGRDGYNDRGATMIGTVHHQRNYVNAFWNGRQIAIGDGDGQVSGPLSADDVVYHEWAHAVTSSEANLTYRNESGALNEATSDIMAAAIESWARGTVDEDVWNIGEDCWLRDRALRFMNNPTEDGSSRDHYQDRYTGSQDNGGVHWNSGIGNLFFYLLSQGGDHPNAARRVNTVTGIGIDSAAQIWYRALTQYMTSSTNFAGARIATERACNDLFGEGSDNCTELGKAWAEVGVGGSGPGPGPGPGDDSCENRCGGNAPSGCGCGSFCGWFGNCCPDRDDQC